ncbi:MAG: IPT/TIG domain-containing protein [Pseudomonadota bacterium]|nr:IPT/TIG domain-containing protein [Pseudomonadota bacterium]
MRLFEGAKVQLYLPGARRVAGFLLVGLLAGCSGGSGGDAATRTEISTNAIAFSAAGPAAETPAAQMFTVTFGGDIAHLAVVHSGDAIASATSVMNGRTAQITVVPAAPGQIGPGPFVGAVAVTGYTCADATCSKLSAGSTSTVSVNYQVSPTIQLVAPYVATAGAPNTVLIRGVGFRAFNVTGVRFGDTAATEIAINQSGTELLATHPALAAGTYTVQLDATNHQGAIPSTVALLVQDPVAYAATTLPLVPGTTNVRSLAYDAERSALLMVTDTAPSNPIVRYAYANGAWGAPTQVAGGFLDAALSADGRQLYGITATTLVPTDPVTLALGTAVTAPSLAENSALKNVVVGNDNRGLVTTSLPSSGATQGYFYDPPSAALILNGTALNNATPAMSAAGSGAIVVQGDPTLTTDVAFYIYSTSNNSLTASAAAALRQNSVPPVVDRSFSRFVLNGTRVYDSNQNFLGTLASTSQAVAISPNGTRAYAYDSTAGGIVVYDISADRDEAAYDPLGAVTPLAGDPGTGVRMIIAPDGATLFLAGSAQIVVQPTPAQ